jgi:hypothetical protein
MGPVSNKAPGKYPRRKIFLSVVAGFFVIAIVAGLLIIQNFNRILSAALMKSFEPSIVSDIYELKFRDLKVNFTLGNIRVKNVEILPREKPLKNYPYINSSLKLRTNEIMLTNVELKTLLQTNVLKLKSIKIDKPEVSVTIGNKIPIFLPFKESVVENDTIRQSGKKAINAYSLSRFALIDASVQIENLAKDRYFVVDNVDITIKDLHFDQQPGKDLVTYSFFDLSIGEVKGLLQKNTLKQISLKDYEIYMNSLRVEKTIDTLIYHFDDLKMALNDLDIHTADSIFHIDLEEFKLSYTDKSVLMKNLAFSPNLNEKEIQKRHKFQNTQFKGSAALVKISGIDFDSLIYRQKILIDEIALDTVNSNFFKDKTKPLDTNRFPEYPAQLMASLKVPILIKQVLSTNANIIYNEIKPDKTRGVANVNKATFKIGNITNINTTQPLSLKTDAYLEGKVRFFMSFNFDYDKPGFSFSGSFPKFDLTDLNPLLMSFTPASVRSGVADKIEFMGIAKKNRADGTMSFLYHDLNVDVQLADEAAWKSSVLSFAANAVVTSANPASEILPPRIVKFHAERDMNKAFINLTLISALDGLKETVLMSKENKKRYKQAKKEFRKENKNSTN